MSKRTLGTCRLTGLTGPLATSHIIPKAFLRRAADAPFIEWGGDGYPRRLPDGWYDKELLTDAGESYFNAVDDAAAKCFVDSGFTYRKRRDPADIGKLNYRFKSGQVYQIDGIDSRVIRLFGLSLLWQASVSKLPAFELVKVSPAHELDLKRCILAADPGPPTEFAVFFGLFCDNVELCKIAPLKPRGLPFVRFFLDGVICYVSPIRRTKNAEQYGKWLAGSEPDRISLFCFPSIGSTQDLLTTEMMNGLNEKHGNPFQAYDSNGKQLKTRDARRS